MRKYYTSLQQHQTQRAFTLVETLVALSVLMVVATYPLVQLSQHRVYTRDSQNIMSATLFAQEGIEIARAIRDSYRITLVDNNPGNDPSLRQGELSVLSDCTVERGTLDNEKICIIDFSDRIKPLTPRNIYSSQSDWTIYNDINLYTSNKNGLVDPNITSTPFTRSIYLEKNSGEHYGTLISQVEWRDSSQRLRNVILKEELFEFQK